MKNAIVYARNKIIGGTYRHILKPLFFLNDPEDIHDSMTHAGAFLGRHRTGRALTSWAFNYSNPTLRQTVLGIDFKNPIGLSAGFDKNAELTDILPSVGFGFAEIGSITGEPCAGNPKPRLWRLKKSKSLLVYYGLKNDGCEAIAKKLTGKSFAIPIGANVAMTNCQATMDTTVAIQDYAKAFRAMEPIASYITVNISCPNTQGGQPFIDPVKLALLFQTLDTIPTNKPIFIKLSPDLTESELDVLLDILRPHRVHGIICTNLTKKRSNPLILDTNVPEKGGLSGKVVQDLADKMLAYVYKKEGQRFIMIGCGGVFTAEDAYKKIKLGATLVELITGMIFEGPQLISEINQGLVKLLQRDGYKNIHDAVGVDALKI